MGFPFVQNMAITIQGQLARSKRTRNGMPYDGKQDELHEAYSDFFRRKMNRHGLEYGMETDEFGEKARIDIEKVGTKSTLGLTYGNTRVAIVRSMPDFSRGIVSSNMPTDGLEIEVLDSAFKETFKDLAQEYKQLFGKDAKIRPV